MTNIKDDLLVDGLDDWTYAAWVFQHAAQSGIEGHAELRALSLGLIAELLVEGLMIAGDVDRDGHHPWLCSTSEALHRITQRWLTEWPDDVPTPGAIVWLANSERGNARAREVLDRGLD